MKILILIICLPIICTQIFYNATEFIEKIRSETPADEAILKEAIEKVKPGHKQEEQLVQYM